MDEFHRKQLEYALSIYPEIRYFEYPYTPWCLEHGGEPKSENHTLAAYYNFGVSKIETTRWMKVDTDQVYFPSILKEVLKLNIIYDGSTTYPCGINALLTDKNELITPGGDTRFNGHGGDTYIVHMGKMNSIHEHTIKYEKLVNNISTKIKYPTPAWIHITQPRRPEYYKDYMVGYKSLTNEFNISKEEWDYAINALVDSVKNTNTYYKL